MQNKVLETFYLFFQGILIFQVLIFVILYFVTGRKDLIYYSLFLFFAAVYFFINAPLTFFGIPENTVWNSNWYDYTNTPIIFIENFFYLLFLKTFFADITIDKTISRIFLLTSWLIAVLIIIFLLFTIFKINKQIIFYSANLIAVVPCLAVAFVVFKKNLPFASLVGKGLLCTIIGTCLTVYMIALGNNGVHSLFTDDYPLFFVRLGVLGDMIFYLTAILRKWHFQEKQLAIEKLHSQKEMLNERLRISRELHDDIGSTLGSISIYSEVIKNRSKKNENADEAIAKMGNASRELIDKMSDIVWSTNPNNESFEQLQNRMQAFAAMILTPRNIQYNFNANEAVKNIQLIAEERKNTYLIYKEAIHNVIKYAECSQVEIKIFLNAGEFVMIVKDNGKGFDINNVQQTRESLGGNGIKNMQARAESINANFSIHSKENAGTTIMLKLKI
jgi:signal transduction histidine kinase